MSYKLSSVVICHITFFYIYFITTPTRIPFLIVNEKKTMICACTDSIKLHLMSKINVQSNIKTIFFLIYPFPALLLAIYHLVKVVRSVHIYIYKKSPFSAMNLIFIEFKWTWTSMFWTTLIFSSNNKYDR